MTLKGKQQLQRRLGAMQKLPKAVGVKWADKDVRLNASRVPVRTGRLRGSFRVKTVTARKAIVSGHFTAYFVDAGPKPHVIKAKRAKLLRFEVGGRTVFARSVHHRGYRARPFRRRAAQQALREARMAQSVIDLWNGAA
jgi:hypothetical protein